MSASRRIGTLQIALRFAWRELRHGVRGFMIFLSCLALGVAAIAAAGSLGATFRTGIEGQSRTLLGGDLAFSLKQRLAAPDEIKWIKARGHTSTVIGLRTMAGPVDARRLVQLRAIDGAYPLVGQVQMDGADDIQAALALKNGVAGIAMNRAALNDFGLSVGDALRIGAGSVRVGGIVVKEPDGLSFGGGLGPRILISNTGLDTLGLITNGALFTVTYRLVLPEGRDGSAVLKDAKARFKDASFDITDRENAAAGLINVLGMLESFLAVIGLAALIAGGLGVAQAVSAFFDQRRASIATLKALGADQNLIAMAFGIQLAVLALGGALIGVIIGALTPFALQIFVGERLPLPAVFALYPRPLLGALVQGVLAAGIFALPALGRARVTPPAVLLRGALEKAKWPPRAELIGALVCALGFALVAILGSSGKILTAVLLVGAVLAFLLFAGLSRIVMAAARGAARRTRGLPRMVFSSLGGPGSAARTAGPALGLGFVLLALVMLVQSNLVHQISRVAPQTSPSLIFTQIPAKSALAFDALLQKNGLDIKDRAHFLRGAFLTGRLTMINGKKIDPKAVKPSERWVINNEVGMSIVDEAPLDPHITAGQWWPTDYAGPPLISMEADAAKGIGAGVGDSLTITVLGRDVVAKIANLRTIDWGGFGANFAVVFAPGTLEAAKPAQIAIVRVPKGMDETLARAVGAAFPGISIVRVREALEAVAGIFADISLAITAIAGVVALASALVLMGALAAVAQSRQSELALLKILGVTRLGILGMMAAEYGLAALIMAGLASALAFLAAFPIIIQVFEAKWAPDWGAALAMIVLATALAAFGGWLSGRKALSAPPARALRQG